MSLVNDLQGATTKEWMAFFSQYPGYTVHFYSEIGDRERIVVNDSERSITIIGMSD